MIDELETLRAWEPADGEADPGARGRARAVLDTHIRSATPARAPRPRRASRPWWTLGLAAAVAAAVAAMLALGSGVQEGGIAPAPATAAQVLERAARAAERQPAAEVFPAPDQFWYVRSEGGDLSCLADEGAEVCTYEVHRRESWQSFTRAGGLRSRVLADTWPTPGQRRRWIRLGRPDIFGRSTRAEELPRLTFWLGNRRLSYLDLLAYRPTPAALYRTLRDGLSPGQGPSPEGEVFTQIGDALREQPVPSALRASLYRALKLIPGVRLGGTVRDRRGRSAIVVARTEGDVRRELLFDPRSWVLLGERAVIVRRGGFGMPDAPPGTVVEDVVYERQAVVDRLGRRPR